MQASEIYAKIQAKAAEEATTKEAELIAQSRLVYNTNREILTKFLDEQVEKLAIPIKITEKVTIGLGLLGSNWDQFKNISLSVLQKHNDGKMRFDATIDFDEEEEGGGRGWYKVRFLWIFLTSA
jgi:hypothetical protein